MDETDESTCRKVVTIEAEPRIDKLALALSKAQAKFVNPEKNRTVTVRHKKDSGSHSYAYATLDAVLDAVRVPLSENGLAFTQIITQQNDKNVLRSVLMHESGQFIESIFPLPSGLAAQDMGAAITYARRYAACPMLGIAGETDTDMEGELEERDLDEEAKAEAEMKEKAERSKEILEKMKKAGKKNVTPVQPASEAVPPVVAPPKQDPPPAEPPKPPAKDIDARLLKLLAQDHITPDAFKTWGVAKGNFPANIELNALREDFVNAVVKNWDKVKVSIKKEAK